MQTPNAEVLGRGFHERKHRKAFTTNEHHPSSYLEEEAAWEATKHLLCVKAYKTAIGQNYTGCLGSLQTISLLGISLKVSIDDPSFVWTDHSKMLNPQDLRFQGDIVKLRTLEICPKQGEMNYIVEAWCQE